MSHKQNHNDLQELRHSAAHLLAHALTTHFARTQLTIGPATEDGFFYDFLPERNIKEEDLALIEATMHQIAAQDLSITHEQMDKSEARILYANNPFKLELIDQIPGDTVGIARQGDFFDLCKGGHVHSTGQIKHFKLTGISGSYWRADRTSQALQRIHGVAFFSAEDLQNYETQKEHLMLYDHRRLGKNLDLFSFHQEGTGFPFFHPKGKLVLNELAHYMRSLLTQAGYQEVSTPMMLSDELWKQSGHYAHYKKNMYFCTIDETNYAIKPMNCPGCILIFKERPRSYRELPLRLAEFGLVHRHELSGVLHGLFRVRAFTIDDGHIFCTVEQLENEILNELKLTLFVLRQFFSNIQVKLATRPSDAPGNDELWQKATDALKNALERANESYTINEGEGAFYGPKLEFHISDSMGRSWQCSTAQVDFFLPERFDLAYVTSSGSRMRPVIVHRAIYGSFERFFGILLEHFKGNLPFWLSPVQVRVLSVTDEQKPYGATIVSQLQKAGLRAEMSQCSDPLSGKIKACQLEKVPWMLIVGKKEVESQMVTLRTREGAQETGLNLETIIERAQKEFPKQSESKI